MVCMLNSDGLCILLTGVGEIPSLQHAYACTLACSHTHTHTHTCARMHIHHAHTHSVCLTLSVSLSLFLSLSLKAQGKVQNFMVMSFLNKCSKKVELLQFKLNMQSWIVLCSKLKLLQFQQITNVNQMVYKSSLTLKAHDLILGCQSKLLGSR